MEEKSFKGYFDAIDEADKIAQKALLRYYKEPSDIKFPVEIEEVAKAHNVILWKTYLNQGSFNNGVCKINGMIRWEQSEGKWQIIYDIDNEGYQHRGTIALALARLLLGDCVKGKPYIFYSTKFWTPEEMISEIIANFMLMPKQLETDFTDTFIRFMKNDRGYGAAQYTEIVQRTSELIGLSIDATYSALQHFSARLHDKPQEIELIKQICRKDFSGVEKLRDKEGKKADEPR